MGADPHPPASGEMVVEPAYLRIGFPTCWCVPAAAAPLLERTETAYRTAWGTETGDELHDDLTDSCVG